MCLQNTVVNYAILKASIAIAVHPKHFPLNALLGGSPVKPHSFSHEREREDLHVVAPLNTYVCAGIFNFGSLEFRFELREKQVRSTRRPGRTQRETCSQASRHLLAVINVIVAHE